jgi:hypothetical protein
MADRCTYDLEYQESLLMPIICILAVFVSLNNVSLHALVRNLRAEYSRPQHKEAVEKSMTFEFQFHSRPTVGNRKRGRE